MKLINQKIRLTELAEELGVSSSALRQHLTNKSPLKEGAEKMGEHVTDDFLLTIDSVSNFLNWLKIKGRKVQMETILKVEEMIKNL